jgi:hypothetical protein
MLRDRLRAIIADFRTQSSLREGCCAILRSDCVHLMQRLQREVRRACPLVYVQRGAGRQGGQWQCCRGGAMAPVAAGEVPMQALAGAWVGALPESWSARAALPCARRACCSRDPAHQSHAHPNLVAPAELSSTSAANQLRTGQGGGAGFPGGVGQQPARPAAEPSSCERPASGHSHRHGGLASSGNLHNLSAALSTLSSQQAGTLSSGGGAASPQVGSVATTPVKQPSSAAPAAAPPGAAVPVKLWVGYTLGAGAAALVLGTSVPTTRSLHGAEGGRHGRGGPEAAVRPLASLLEV